MVMTSPSFNTVSSLIGAPLSSVPLPEPRSLTAQPSAVLRTTACLRLTDVSGMETGLSAARPMTTSSPLSGKS